MFVQGHCKIREWPEKAVDDLEMLLSGESPEWQGPSWTGIVLSENWDISRGRHWIEISSDSADEEPFEVDDLILMAQSVMRHHGIEGNIRIESWGIPEGGETDGDGQATYVNRYGSIHINPMAMGKGGSLSDLEGALDRWKKELALMNDPEKRECLLGSDANVWMHEKAGVVHLGTPDSFRGIPRDQVRVLDVAAAGGAHEIVVNIADLCPKAKCIIPRSLPHEVCYEITKAAQGFRLNDSSRKPRPE